MLVPANSFTHIGTKTNVSASNLAQKLGISSDALPSPPTTAVEEDETVAPEQKSSFVESTTNPTQAHHGPTSDDVATYKQPNQGLSVITYRPDGVDSGPNDIALYTTSTQPPTTVTAVFDTAPKVNTVDTAPSDHCVKFPNDDPNEDVSQQSFISRYNNRCCFIFDLYF